MSPLTRTTPLKRMSEKKKKSLTNARVFSSFTAPLAGIKKVNPERQQKAAKRGRSKHAQYMASETRRVVDERADGMCEYRVMCCDVSGEWRGPVRCCMTEGLEHHHVTYARYGGAELPDDILVVCKAHHDYLEALRQSRLRASARAGGG